MIIKGLDIWAQSPRLHKGEILVCAGTWDPNWPNFYTKGDTYRVDTLYHLRHLTTKRLDGAMRLRSVNGHSGLWIRKTFEEVNLEDYL